MWSARHRNGCAIPAPLTFFPHTSYIYVYYRPHTEFKSPCHFLWIWNTVVRDLFFVNTSDPFGNVSVCNASWNLFTAHCATCYYYCHECQIIFCITPQLGDYQHIIKLNPNIPNENQKRREVEQSFWTKLTKRTTNFKTSGFGTKSFDNKAALRSLDTTKVVMKTNESGRPWESVRSQKGYCI